MQNVSEAVALKAHMHNDGLVRRKESKEVCFVTVHQFVRRDEKLAMELFRQAASMRDVSATTLSNLGLLERESGNR